MKVFIESQRFRQWWLYAILGSTFIAVILPFFKDGSSENIWILIISLLIVVSICLLFFNLELYTRIDFNGIKTQFKPFSFLSRSYSWKEIESCYVRKYSPITEYGGWGVRGLGTASAYNVSGNMGIQLILKNGKRFLIGTHKENDARRILKQFQPDSEKQKT